MSTRRLLALPVLLAGLIAPASAAAWTVTVHVHGAGKVEEVPNRFGEEKHQLDCTVPPGGMSEASVTDCVGGSLGGLWNSGNIVKLLASVPADAAARGWQVSRYVDGNASHQINCDPQNTTGDHVSSECEFQIFDNLFVDLYFDDTHGPTDTAVTSGPSGTTNQTAPTFGFDAPSDPDATFECRLDTPAGAGSFAPCGSPADKSEPVNASVDGAYTFFVRSFDPSGNLGSDTASDSRSFTLDTTAPPAPSFTSAPPSPSNDTSPTFAFASESGATFQCALDSDSYSACSSPHTYPGPLAAGPHTFKVRAVDSLGNGPGPAATREWTIDTVAPDTTLLSGPAAGSTSPSDSATFTFSSPQSGATFQCRIDAEAFSACTSPHTRSALANGDHTFQVRAVDAAGNADGSPASRTWTVNDLDRDGDGIPRPADCDDGNATIRPGAFDVPEDGIDQDCDGVDARWLTPNTSLTYLFAFQGKRTRVAVLRVRRVPPGGTVQVRCVGGRKKGCKFKQRGVRVRNKVAKPIKVVRKLRLKPGAVLEVRISVPGMATKVSRFTIRKRPKQPRLKTACLKPGAKRLSACT
jgi:hypothetical protein